MDLANIIFDLDGGPPVRHILSEISGEERAEELGGSEAAFRESYDVEDWNSRCRYGRLPRLFGEPDELGSMFARAGGVA